MSGRARRRQDRERLVAKWTRRVEGWLPKKEYPRQTAMTKYRGRGGRYVSRSEWVRLTARRHVDNGKSCACWMCQGPGYNRAKAKREIEP